MKRRIIRIILLLVLVLVLANVGYALRKRLFPRANGLPAEVMPTLHAPREMTLYSLIPYGASEGIVPGAPVLHGFYVLGKKTIATPEERDVVAETVRRAVSAWDGKRMMCFNPRHAVRVTDGARVYDLVICFECQRVLVFDGSTDDRHGQAWASAGLTGSQAPLDEILRAAGVDLPSGEAQFPPVRP